MWSRDEARQRLSLRWLDEPMSKILRYLAHQPAPVSRRLNEFLGDWRRKPTHTLLGLVEVARAERALGQQLQ
jgi:hypothetical protein